MTIGHNTVAGDRLKSLIERIERLEEEKKTIADDIKDVFAEAKANGFDTKVMRHVLRLRRQDRDQREEQQALLDLYLQALGMAGPDLFDAAGAIKEEAPPQ